MNLIKSISCLVVASISVANFLPLPVVAIDAILEEKRIERQQRQLNYIPEGHAIVIGITQSIGVTAETDETHHISAILLGEITNQNGEVISPANVPVTAKLVIIEGEAYIEVESLIINGKVQDVNTSRIEISTQEIDAQQAENLDLDIVGTVIGSAVSSNESNQLSNARRGLEFGTVANWIANRAGKKTEDVVIIKEGSHFILKLQNPVNLAQ